MAPFPNSSNTARLPLVTGLGFVALLATTPALSGCFLDYGDCRNPDGSSCASGEPLEEDENFKGNPTDDEAAYLFSMDEVRTYSITMDPADWEEMQGNLQSDAFEDWEEYFPATLSLEGQIVDDVAFRFKGGWGTLASCIYKMRDPELPDCDKFSFKIKFNEWDDTKRFYGLKRLNFNNMVNDKARMHEVLSYSLYRDMEVPAPRATFANLEVNGENFGVFSLVEAVDSEFVESRFVDDEGFLFKEIWPSTLNLDDADWPLSQNLKTHRDEYHEFNKMKEFASASQSMGDAGYDEVMNTYMADEAFDRYMVVDRVIENFDGILGFYCFEGYGCNNHNFYLYEEERGDKHWVIPWDLDLTFPTDVDPNNVDYGLASWTDDSNCDWVQTVGDTYLRPSSCDPMIGGYTSKRWDRYIDLSREALSGPLALDKTLQRIDEIAALLRPEITTDPKTHLTPEDWEFRVDLLKDNAELHYLNILNLTESN